MSDLFKKVLDIVSDARVNSLQGDNIPFKNSVNYAAEILALLPSLEGWVKVEKCEHYHKGCNGTFLSGGNCAADCHGTGEIVTSLEFGDVDWDKLLIDFLACKEYLAGRNGYYSSNALVTKSGEVIRRNDNV